MAVVTSVLLQGIPSVPHCSDMVQHRLMCTAQSAWECLLVAVVTFGLALNKQRFPKLEYGFSIALLTFPIVAIPGEAPCMPG